MTHLNNNQRRQNCPLWVLALTDLIFFLLHARNRGFWQRCEFQSIWQNCWPLWETLASFDVTSCWANSISGTRNILGLYCFPSIFIQWHYHCSPITDISQMRLLERAQGWCEGTLKWPKDFVASSCPLLTEVIKSLMGEDFLLENGKRGSA